MIAADTISPLLQLLLMGDGLHNDDWGDQTNTNLGKIETAISGVTALTGLTGGTVTLTNAQSLAAIITLAGALTSNLIVVVPAAISNKWTFVNSTTGAFTVTVETPAGSGATVPQTGSANLFSDGTNVYGITLPSDPVGIVEEYYGLALPDSRYVWANGQALSRTAYSAAFNALTGTVLGNYGAGVTAFGVNADLTGLGIIGAIVEGVGIPAGATITALTSTAMTISAATTGTLTAKTIRFFPYGNGDGSTTFNVPDRRERGAIGNGVMGATADPGLVTSATVATGANLGATGGTQTVALTAAQNALHSHGVTDSGHVHGTTESPHAHSYTLYGTGNIVTGGSSFAVSPAPTSPLTGSATTGLSVNSATTGITINNQGSGAAHNNMPPLLVCNFIMRVA